MWENKGIKEKRIESEPQVSSLERRKLLLTELQNPMEGIVMTLINRDDRQKEKLAVLGAGGSGVAVQFGCKN